MSVVGLDVGNENCYIAIVRAGGIEVVDNEYSIRATPSYVAFTGSCRELGLCAKTKLIPNLDNTIFGFKKIMGREFSDPVTQNEIPYLPYEICELPSGNIGIKVSYLNKYVVFSVKQIMAMMLTKLKSISETKLGIRVRDCVISVPIYFNDIERRAMSEAAEISGLRPLKLMNEPSAVALAFGYYKQDLPENEPLNVVFVDFGHSALTATACAFTKEKVKILGCVWDRNIGGRDFDNVLVKYFVDDFKKRYHLDVMSHKKAIMALMLECETLKKQMSANPLELSFNIECFMQDKDVSGRMKREIFENLASPLFQKIEKTLRNLLDETELKVQDIQSVQIVGGSCRIPAVKAIIQEVFCREPNASLNQDEAVARGCALECALQSPTLKTRNFVIDDIQPYSIKIKWKDQKLDDYEIEVFPRFHKVPANKMITFCADEDFSFEAFYSDSREPKTLFSIGNFSIENVPPEVKCSSCRIKVKAKLDINGIFSVNSAILVMQIDATATNEKKDKVRSCEDAVDENQTTDQDVQDVDMATRKVHQSYELVVRSTVPCLSREELNAFIEKELQMVNVDTLEKEKADARNLLEEYVYDMRGKLRYELDEFIVEHDKTSLLQSLMETENWLYSKDHEKHEFWERLRSLKDYFDPVLVKYKEWEERSAVMEEFRYTLETSYKIMNSLSKDKPNAFKQHEERDLLETMLSDFKQYLDRCVNLFSKSRKHEDIPITVAMIREEIRKFKKQFQEILDRLKNKVDCPLRKDNAAAGDGKADAQKETRIQNEDPDVRDDSECGGSNQPAGALDHALDDQSQNETQLWNMKID